VLEPVEEKPVRGTAEKLYDLTEFGDKVGRVAAARSRKD
jgi:hypothetical protein